MSVFSNILIFQPAAIGDVMLATPVAKALKQNYPGSKITFWGHGLLRPLLLGLCPYIDEYIDYDRKAGLISLLKTFWSVQCDLYVDLSNSKKGIFLSAFSSSGVRVLGYRKQPATETDRVHAANNFLATIAPVCEEMPSALFPTIFAKALADDVLTSLSGHHYTTLIGLVPGVGKLRPHRAWLPDAWHYLLEALVKRPDCLPILIGGEEEVELGKLIEADLSDRCLNLIGELELLQTAAVLKQCRVVVSGDTGPAHIAVAVGTPVIGLYGPTYPQRSGPYGNEDLIIDQSQYCSCHEMKVCRYCRPDEPGECMRRIMLTEVLDKLNQVLSQPSELDNVSGTEEFNVI